MLGDVLFEAHLGIEDYQQSMPDVYGNLTAEITVVKTVIDSLRLFLDSAPGDPGQEFVANEIRLEIARLNLAGLEAARERFLTYVRLARLNMRRKTSKSRKPKNNRRRP